MFKLVFFLATCILACQSVKVTNGSTKYDLTDEAFFNLQNNSLRKGFDTFIRISNLFIDRTFLPNVTLSNIMNASEMMPKEGLFMEYVKVPQNYYPSLFYFLLSVLLLAFLISILGFIFCSYRCCCNKIDLHDRRGDSFKRKTYTFFLFTTLMAILICSIVLFFTNMNASNSFRNTKGVVKDVMVDLDKFNSNEMPVFYQAIEKNTDFTSNSANNLIKEILVKYLDEYFKTINQSFYLKDLNEDIFNIVELVNATDNQEVINAVDNMDINIQLVALENEIKSQMDTSVIDLKGLSDEIKENMDTVRAIVDDLVSGLSPNTTNARNIEEQLDVFSKYYDVIYFTLMAVNVAVLFLFLLYSIGTVGICARRSSPKKRKCCDRTTHAKLLLSGVGFFVLFSFILLIVAIALLVPGILTRQVICTPVIEMENSKLYMSLEPELKQVMLEHFAFLPELANQTDLVDNLASIKLATVLRECDQFERSDEMERFILEILKDGQNLLPLDGLLSELPGAKKLETFISQFVEKLKELEQKVAILVISDPKPQYLEIKNQVDLLIGSLENQLISDKQSENFRTLVTELRELKTKSMSGSISSILVKTVQNIFRDMPSCRGISDIYKKIVTNVCFEYVDNMNAYWFFLVVIVLLNILITIFAVKQSNLFRKYLAYNMMSENHSPYKEKYMEPTTAIDAYEMDDYHKFNYNYKTKQQNEKVIFKRAGATGNTPPPQYF